MFPEHDVRPAAVRAALNPGRSEERIYWGMGIAEDNRFLTGIFR